MLQLLVYAGMQVPVGLLVDRFGPRTVLTAGVVTISLAQRGSRWRRRTRKRWWRGCSSAWATR